MSFVPARSENDSAEVNLDGVVGPSHHYGGLSEGNLASMRHGGEVSNPRKAALQGLAKMKCLHDLGIGQLVMPPQPRPDRAFARALGFREVSALPEGLLSVAYSASSMWTANAATVSPAADTMDGKTHLTPANLISTLHRSRETAVTANYLRQIFPQPAFAHEAALPTHSLFADEGAANHMRLVGRGEDAGLAIFVYGAKGARCPARQSRLASEAVIRAHGLASARVMVLEQSAAAIDAGVFHNDVIAMSNEEWLIHHACAYGAPLRLPAPYRQRVIEETELPLKMAVQSYFFNSQFITLPDAARMIIAPEECEQMPAAKRCLARLREEGVTHHIRILGVGESMKNGGGPACLRLRLTLMPHERAEVHKPAWLSDANYPALVACVERHYRDRLTLADLRDPHFAEECDRAVAALLFVLEMQAPIAEMPHAA